MPRKPRDAEGRVLLAAGDWLVGAAGELLSQMDEVAEGEYLAATRHV